MIEPDLRLSNINAYVVAEVPYTGSEEPVGLHVIEHGFQPMLQHQEGRVAMHVEGQSSILATDPVPGVQWKQLALSVGMYVCVHGFESL